MAETVRIFHHERPIANPNHTYVTVRGYITSRGDWQFEGKRTHSDTIHRYTQANLHTSFSQSFILVHSQKQASHDESLKLSKSIIF
jgi:hypothetical protein